MTILVVEIDLEQHIPEDVIRSSIWQAGHPEGYVSVDNAFLKIDEYDDSFYVFKLIEVKETTVDDPE